MIDEDEVPLQQNIMLSLDYLQLFSCENCYESFNFQE